MIVVMVMVVLIGKARGAGRTALLVRDLVSEIFHKEKETTKGQEVDVRRCRYIAYTQSRHRIHCIPPAPALPVHDYPSRHLSIFDCSDPDSDRQQRSLPTLKTSSTDLH